MTRLLAALALLSSSASAGTIFVSDEERGCVHAIDEASLKILERIAVGQRPRGLALSRDGRHLYVAVSNENHIAIVDTVTRKVVRTIASGPDPETFALSPDETQLYIGNEDDSQLTIIDLPSGKTLREVPVGAEPEGTAVSPDGRMVVQASEGAGMAHVVDAGSGKVTANLLVDTRPRYVAFTPDGRQFWVSSEVRGTVTAFDSATLKSAGTIDFEAAKLTAEPIQPVGVRFTRDGKRAFVALGRGKLVAEVDPASLRIVRTWPVGLRAWNLALSPDETRIYTADGLDGTVSIIDLKADKALAPIRLGGKPWGIEVAR